VGAMLSRLLCKERIAATPPRKHVEARYCWRPPPSLDMFTCFRGELARAELLQTSRESMAPANGFCNRLLFMAQGHDGQQPSGPPRRQGAADHADGDGDQIAFEDEKPIQPAVNEAVH
jgi:hypothetical protein